MGRPCCFNSGPWSHAIVANYSFIHHSITLTLRCDTLFDGISFIFAFFLSVAAKKRYSEGKFFLSKQTAHEFLSKRNQGWQTQGKFFRGISCECCHYRCDLPELTQYCAESAYEKKRTVLKPLHRKRSTGSDLTLADLTDKGKVAMVEPTTLVGAAQKTYRHIPREKFTPSKQEPHPRHILSS